MTVTNCPPGAGRAIEGRGGMMTGGAKMGLSL
jgi:hypothetical protein